MIVVQDTFLSRKEVEFLLKLWDDNNIGFSKNSIRFYAYDLKANNEDITCIQNGIFDYSKFQKIRLQKYNETFDQLENYHEHENIYNYVIFLNENFVGGELEFSNGVVIRPRTGTLVYFTNNERHRVRACKGDRYIFTALGDYEADVKLKTMEKETLVV